jgi:hypothetical protein
MTNIMKHKAEPVDWDGQSVSDLADVIRRTGKIQKPDIAAAYRAPFYLRTHPAKLIAMDSEKNLISSDGETVMSLNSAHWELTFSDYISEHIEILYPEEIEKKGIKLRSGLLKTGKLGYFAIGVEVFSIFESSKKSSLPGDRSSTTLHYYKDHKLQFPLRECDTLIKAFDEYMFEILYAALQVD